MDKYYVVGLTHEEVAARGLSQIGDAIREDFMNTAQAASQRRIAPPQQSWMIIRFQDPMMENFPEEYKEYFSVLYVNSVAKEVLDRKGVQLRVLREITELPDDIGTFMSMPHYE